MPNFQVREFSVNAQFLQMFWRIAQISAKTQHLWKIGFPGN